MRILSGEVWSKDAATPPRPTPLGPFSLFFLPVFFFFPSLHTPTHKKTKLGISLPLGTPYRSVSKSFWSSHHPFTTLQFLYHIRIHTGRFTNQPTDRPTGQSDRTERPDRAIGQSDRTERPDRVTGQSDRTERPDRATGQSDRTASQPASQSHLLTD